jgi:hypothetical protein
MDVSESLTVVGLEQQLEEASRQGKKGALVDAPTQLVSWWYRSDPAEESFPARFRLVSPAGVNIFEQSMDVLWGEDKMFSRVFLNLDKIPVSRTGLYWFVVEHQQPSKNKKPRWVAATRIPLRVEKG